MSHNADIQAQAFPVPFDDIRHVIPLEDTETGKLENVLVKHAYAAGPYHERAPHSKLPRYSRYVAGLDIEIPWPMEEEPVITDGEMDTPRMEVEASTFAATLSQPPMPSTVIDELRNKYGKFRTRHDPEYLRAKMMEDYEKEYKETVSLTTPKTEAANMRAAKALERRKARTDADGNLKMSKDTIKFITEQMQKATIATQPAPLKTKAKQAKPKQTKPKATA
jgi:large subunit ribosomal protein L24